MPMAFFARDPGNRQQATGNYNNSLTGNVNKPIAYITSHFSISVQSVCFYSHYFGKMPFAFWNGFFNKSLVRSFL